MMTGQNMEDIKITLQGQSAKSIVCIAQVVLQPLQTSEILPDFTL
jgi:hypothetical protein